GVAGRVAVGLAVGVGGHVQITQADGVIDRPGGVVVVAGGVVEAPAVAVIGAGRCVGGAGQRQAGGQVFAEDARGRPGRGVARRIVGDAVGGYVDGGIGLGDRQQCVGL